MVVMGQKNIDDSAGEWYDSAVGTGNDEACNQDVTAHRMSTMAVSGPVDNAL